MIVDGIIVRIAAYSHEDESIRYLKEINSRFETNRWSKCNFFQSENSSLFFILHYLSFKQKQKDKIDFNYTFKRNGLEQARGEFTIKRDDSYEHIHRIFGPFPECSGYPFTILNLDSLQINSERPDHNKSKIFTNECPLPLKLKIEQDRKGKKRNLSLNSIEEKGSPQPSTPKKVVEEWLDSVSTIASTSGKRSKTASIKLEGETVANHIAKSRSKSKSKQNKSDAPILLQAELRQKLEELKESIETLQEKMKSFPKIEQSEEEKTKEKYKQKKEKIKKEYKKSLIEIKETYDQQRRECKQELNQLRKLENETKGQLTWIISNTKPIDIDSSEVDESDVDTQDKGKKRLLDEDLVKMEAMSISTSDDSEE